MLCLLLFIYVAVIGLGVSADDPLPWWKTAVLYQVYPRSFKDSDGDGIGDLKGINQEASYFKEIGVTAIWLSPIFQSPMADFGYDVSDFRAIDPTFGTMDDFKELIQTMKSLDIKLLLDLVPNHSSDQHQWFQWSVQGKEPYKDYYVWSDGKKDLTNNETHPINNWLVTYGDQASRSHDIYDLIMSWMTNITKDDTPNWVIGNHDRSQVAQRYGPEAVDVMNLLTGVLPGVKVTYYGEEIGMSNTFVRWDQTVDNMAKLVGPTRYLNNTRDPVRTPMQWNSSNNAGFTSGKPWLPVNPDYWRVNVEAQRSAPTSHLKVFQAMAKARTDPVLQKGELNITVPDDDTLIIIRTYNGSWYALITNLGSEVMYLLRVGTGGLQHRRADRRRRLNFQKGEVNVSLRPRAAILLRSGQTRLVPTTNSANSLYSANSISLSSVTFVAIFVQFIRFFCY